MSSAALPKQVQAQLDEADRIQAQLAQQAAPIGDTAGGDTPPDGASHAPAASADVVPMPQDEWQQRYETLQGKFSAEVPRLHEAVRERDGVIQSLNQRLQQLEQAMSNNAATQTPPKAKALVTPKDEETFGTDLIDAMRRVTREETQALLTRIGNAEKYIQQSLQAVDRFQRVEQEVATTRQDRFWAEVESAVPEWKAINSSKEWLAWLAEYDPLAGAVRQQALAAAQQGLDHQRVIAMFKLFMGGPKAQSRSQAQPNAELARQVAPSRSATSTSAPTEKRTYTGADYQYWVDHRRTHDTPKDKLDAMRAEMERAYSEGRIQW